MRTVTVKSTYTVDLPDHALPELDPVHDIELVEAVLYIAAHTAELQRDHEETSLLEGLPRLYGAALEASRRLAVDIEHRAQQATAARIRLAGAPGEAA